MEGVAAPTSVGVACAKHMDSLVREAQGGARRYVSRHRMSPNAWSSPTLRPSSEVECTPHSQSRPPINPDAADGRGVAGVEIEVVCRRWSGTLAGGSLTQQLQERVMKRLEEKLSQEETKAFDEAHQSSDAAADS